MDLPQVFDALVQNHVALSGAMKARLVGCLRLEV